MRSPTYLTDSDVTRIISLRGLRRPCEVSREYKIGLSRLYKLWSKTSQSAVTRGDPTEYIETRKRYRTRAKELATENSKLRDEIDSLNASAASHRETISATQQQIKEL